MTEVDQGLILDAWPRHQVDSANATAWSRLWARGLDVQLYAVGLLILGTVVIPTALASIASINEYMIGLVVFPFALVLEAVVFRIAGNSLGKAIAGIRLQRGDGKPLTLANLIGRNFYLWIMGYAAGVPFIAFFTLWSARRELTDSGKTPWDRESNTVVLQNGASGARTVAAFICMMLVGIAARTPGFTDTFSPTYSFALGALELDKTLPKQVDDVTRLDHVTFVAPNLVEQHMTIIKADGTKLPFGQIVTALNSGEMRASLLKNYCSSAQFSTYRDAGMGVRFIYSDAEEHVAADFRFAPSNCRAG